jgi:GR25 family glycosyltransferase involved in LPS biosynthesis
LEFKRAGLAELVQFVVVDKHPSDSEQGIFESHMNCLRLGLAAGAESILVFEDDVTFKTGIARRLAEAVEFLKSESAWRVLFLGCFVNASRKTSSTAVMQIRYRCLAHAYAVNRAFAERLVAMPWRGVAFDDMLRELGHEGYYTIYPAIAFQSASTTDNDKMLIVDRIRRRLGGMRRLQRWNEFSSRHFWGIFAAHVAFALLCIVVFLLYRFSK